MKKPEQIVRNDQELVRLAQKDRRAFAHLYDRYFERLYLFIYKRVRDEAIAGDICQDAMLKAMLNIGKYENRGAPFSAWLYRIASNEANLYFRRAKKRIVVEIKEKDLYGLMREVELNATPKVDEQEKLIVVLNGLKPEQAEIIDLRFFMHYSFKEIAEFYSISEANAKMRLYRIIDRLKKGVNTK